MTRYAEGTTVSVEKSQAEMIATLARYKVRKFGWDFGDDGHTLFFEIGDRAYRMKVPKPQAKEFEYNPRVATATLIEREWQRRWRAHAMMLKMRLDFAGSGDSTVEIELLPYLLTEGGQTISELVHGGHIPLLAPGVPA